MRIVFRVDVEKARIAFHLRVLFQMYTGFFPRFLNLPRADQRGQEPGFPHLAQVKLGLFGEQVEEESGGNVPIIDHNGLH